MIAKEARKLAKYACADEIKSVCEQIEKCASEGLTSITINDLKDGTVAWLVENGYECSYHYTLSRSIHTIEWR
jgi:hypothetical protein